MSRKRTNRKIGINWDDRETVAAYQHEWYLASRARMRPHRTEYMKTYRAENADKLRAASRRRYLKRIDVMKQRSRKTHVKRQAALDMIRQAGLEAELNTILEGLNYGH